MMTAPRRKDATRRNTPWQTEVVDLDSTEGKGHEPPAMVLLKDVIIVGALSALVLLCFFYLLFLTGGRSDASDSLNHDEALLRGLVKEAVEIVSHGRPDKDKERIARIYKELKESLASTQRLSSTALGLLEQLDSSFQASKIAAALPEEDSGAERQQTKPDDADLKELFSEAESLLRKNEKEADSRVEPHDPPPLVHGFWSIENTIQGLSVKASELQMRVLASSVTGEITNGLTIVNVPRHAGSRVEKQVRGAVPEHIALATASKRSPDLSELYQHCSSRPQDVVWFHASPEHLGDRHTRSSQLAYLQEWKMYLEYAVLWNAELCVDAIKHKGYDLCGVNWKQSEEAFMGDVWWAKCSYVATLSNPKHVPRTKMSERFTRSRWIGQSSGVTVCSIHASNVNHFREGYDPAEYKAAIQSLKPGSYSCDNYFDETVFVDPPPEVEPMAGKRGGALQRKREARPARSHTVKLRQKHFQEESMNDWTGGLEDDLLEFEEAAKKEARREAEGEGMRDEDEGKQAEGKEENSGRGDPAVAQEEEKGGGDQREADLEGEQDEEDAEENNF